MRVTVLVSDPYDLLNKVGCEEFVIDQINPAINAEGIKDVIDLRLIPYGNAHEYQQGGKYVYCEFLA
jgi:transcription antitermination factor NusG